MRPPELPRGQWRRPPVLLAGLLAFLLVAITLSASPGSDYAIESLPAFAALSHGHIGLFLDRCPAYGGSLILRAPFALLPNLWGGGSLAVFRAVSAPAVLALFVFALLLWSAAERRRIPRAGWVALLLVLMNPLAYVALRVGHPEEILVACACIAAAVAASRGRPGLAGALLGGAVASKPWAIIALAPLLLGLEDGRMRFLASAGGVAAAIVAPIVLHGGASVTATTTVAHSTGTIANPWQIWWFLGDHVGPVYRGLGHVRYDYRTEPPWVTSVSHPAVVIVPALLCALRYRALRGRPGHDVLLLLAAVFFARCLLDTWNHHYYAFAAVLALGSWEVLARHREPRAAWGLTALHFFTIAVLPSFASADVQAAIYLVWSLPFLAALLTAAFAPQQWAVFVRRMRRGRVSGEPAPGHIAEGFRANDPDEVLLAYR
jgi:Glycosyltransferase family 87